MNWNFLRTLACLAFICLFVGCGNSKYMPVSGKVTYEGKPAAGIQLIFNPLGDNANSAPLSVAITDEDGGFSLKTRDGNLGVVAGLHKVGFSWSDIRSYTIQDLKESLREAKGDAAEVARIKAEIADVKQKLATRPALDADLQTQFTVPDGGTEEAIFELVDL